MSDAPVVVEHATTEAEATAAVEIAGIQADAAVTINEQNNEAAVAIAEIAAEEEDDLVWLKGELAGLQGAIATLRADYENLLTQNALQQAEIAAIREDLVAMAALAGAAAGVASATAETTTESTQQASSEATEAEMTEQAETVAAEAAAVAGDAAGHAEAQQSHERKRRYLR